MTASEAIVWQKRRHQSVEATKGIVAVFIADELIHLAVNLSFNFIQLVGCTELKKIVDQVHVKFTTTSQMAA